MAFVLSNEVATYCRRQVRDREPLRCVHFRNYGGRSKANNYSWGKIARMPRAFIIFHNPPLNYRKTVLGIGYPDPYLGGRPDRYLIWIIVGQTDTWILGRYLGSIWVSVCNSHRKQQTVAFMLSGTKYIYLILFFY
jgi:hypothetical protein